MLKIDVDIKPGSAPPEAVVSLDDGRGRPPVRFRAGFFTKKVLSEGRVFSDINAFFETISHETQLNIYEAFKSINSAIDSLDMSHVDMTEYISDRVKVITDVCDPMVMGKFLTRTNRLFVPKDIPTRYQQDEDNVNSNSKTFVQSEYIQLITLATVLRPILPVWGEYVAEYRKEVEGDSKGNKEEICFRFLSKSLNIHDYPAMEKLRTYIEAMTVKERENQQHALGSVAAIDRVDSVLAVTCVKLLASVDTTTNIMPYLSSNVRGKAKPPDSASFSGIVRLKEFSTGNDSDGDRNRSVVEDYQGKYALSPAEIAYVNIFAEEPLTILKIVKDQKLFDMFIASRNNILKYQNPNEHQLWMLSWFVKSNIPPCGVYYMRKDVMSLQMAVFAYYCYENGFHDLSMLVMSTHIPAESDGFIGNVDRRSAPSQELIEAFEAKYPFTRRQSTKTVKANTSNNIELNNVYDVARTIIGKKWKCLCTDELLKLFGKRRTNEYGSFIAAELLKLRISIEENNVF